MLFATGKLTRRLFRKGDPYNPSREGAKTIPSKDDIPAEYHYLLDWYNSAFSPKRVDVERTDPILALRGLGKEISTGEHPDDYVRRLREGWE